MQPGELIYSERRPRSDLQQWIQSLWSFDAAALAASAYEHFVPPDGCISILSKRQEDPSRSFFIVVGPRCQPHQVPIHRGDCYDGVRFWPFAARALIGGKLFRLTGQIAPLAVYAPVLSERIVAALQQLPASKESPCHLAVQAALAGLLPLAAKLDPLVCEATFRIIAKRGIEPVAAMAAHLGIGLRQLQRRFKHDTGLTLKQFARVRRFREAAGELLRHTKRPWCQVALDAGYADQAHLTREFSQMMGLSAKELEVKHATIRHDAVQP